MSVILASGSPRRRELMEMLRVPGLEIIPARGEEHPPAHATPEETVKALARAKAREVAEHRPPEDVVIGADTMVALHGALLGKPHSPEEAKDMLRALSGRSHEVWTSSCPPRMRQTPVHTS